MGGTAQLGWGMAQHSTTYDVLGQPQLSWAQHSWADHPVGRTVHFTSLVALDGSVDQMRHDSSKNVVM